MMVKKLIFVSKGLKDIIGEKSHLVEKNAKKKLVVFQEVKIKCVLVTYQHFIENLLF